MKDASHRHQGVLCKSTSDVRVLADQDEPTLTRTADLSLVPHKGRATSERGGAVLL